MQLYLILLHGSLPHCLIWISQVYNLTTDYIQTMIGWQFFFVVSNFCVFITSASAHNITVLLLHGFLVV